jgi:hypothetical protein
MTYETLPSLHKWQGDSSVALKVRHNDVVLKRIDNLLEHIHAAKSSADRFIFLSDLYFTTDYWLKTFPGNALMEKGREKAVHALFTRAAFDLCDTFDCTINGLPRELELMWGREMSAGGVHKDLVLNHAEYITRAEAAKFKVYFKGGRAFQYPWWAPANKWTRVLAESRHAFDQQAFVLASRKPGAYPNNDYGFFILTMGRDLYMTKHRAGGDNNPGFFHSSYTGGDPIACAGTMLIRAGVIQRIRFDSGHYQPHANSARNLVMALRMRAVPVDTVAFEDFNGYPLGYDASKGAAQDPDIGTVRYVLRATSTMPFLSAGRDKTLGDNQAAFGRRPAANPDPSVQGPDPRSWWGNRPRQPDVQPPPIKKI